MSTVRRCEPYHPVLDMPRTRGKLIASMRIDDADTAQYRRASGRAPVGPEIKDWSDQMTMDLDRENSTGWWTGFCDAAANAAPLGAYVLTAAVSLEGQADDIRVVASGLLRPDQHGAGHIYQVDGPWLCSGHVFRPYRGNGYHYEIVRARLEALVTAGFSEANVSIAQDNARSLATAKKAGFREFALGPDLDPDGKGTPLVFLHWEASYSLWAIRAMAELKAKAARETETARHAVAMEAIQADLDAACAVV